MDMEITKQDYLKRYKEELLINEKSKATIEKYVSEVKLLLDYLEDHEQSKASILEYRDALRKNYQARTVNGKLAAIHSFLQFIDKSEWKVKFLKIQRRAFAEESRELTEKEYRKLLETAKSKKENRLYYLMLTLGGTGIRISELQYITLEAVKRGKAEIDMKGKCRIILIPKGLKEKLLSYASQAGIQNGYLFKSRNGKPLNRSNIWRELKRLCEDALVNPNKVFPHNFRHLFAKCYYAIEKDIAHLADILGHSSVETTRCYIAVSLKEHEETLTKLQLII